MKTNSFFIPLLPAFQKFITASSTGRRLMPSGKKISSGTIEGYRCVLLLLHEFEALREAPIRIRLLHRASLRTLQQEKNYWGRFFKQFTCFLYMKKNCYDQYAGTVFKVIKVFFRYLLLEKALPVGEFYKRFRVPVRRYNPVILSPMQLRFLITDTEFGRSLSASLKRVKDIFVFGCTVALRYSDLMRLRKTNIQDGEEGVYVVLHTGKTCSEIRVPLPVYARDIISRYRKATGVYLLPRLSVSNLNLGIKALVKKAGWDHYLPKIRYRRGVAVEVKTRLGKTFRFYDHMTAHTMRRTAITTLLLLGVDENSVRGISGHAPGSRDEMWPAANDHDVFSLNISSKN